MIFLDSKYIGLISARLDKIKKVKPDLYNFRCPYCGDSKKHKNKKRGYLYKRKTDFNFKCHNCGVSKSFTYFLKDLDRQLYDQYVLDRYKEGLTGKATVTPEPDFKKIINKPVFKTKINLPLASTNDRAREYLSKRKLNPTKFYYAQRFKHFCNTHKPTFESTRNDHPRIIIPMYDKNKKLIGFQGRALDNYTQPKYLTIMLDEDAPKLYGLDTIDETKPIYILEGPFDSTFVENSVAMCGSDVDIRSLGWSNYIWVFDNEPRNREIVTKISKCIGRGEQVVIFPHTIPQKDVNDMVLGGQNIKNVLESNTYKNLQAELKFTNWKRNEQRTGQKTKRFN